MRILMRASMSPLVSETPLRVLTRNMVGNNIGNMLFPYGICRVLMKEGTQIDTVTTKYPFSGEEIRFINENYDYLVLPFANAFRYTFINELKRTTALVERLKIPVAVIGIGVQKPNKEENPDLELDKAVKYFMKTVLQKTNYIGVRGEVTAAYLQRLGFQAERDFTVIGCPSMYTFGASLPEQRPIELTPESKVSYNSKISLSGEFHDFIERSRTSFRDAIYVPQVIEEIFRMYAAMPYPKTFKKYKPSCFPILTSHPIYQKDQAISFINVPAWLDYLSKRDFSFGSRIHGNIAAILAGTPCYIVVSDSRIKELVDYHHIPHCMMADLKTDTSIFRLYEQANFSTVQKHHRKNFEHYRQFLLDNHLPNIFENADSISETPFDRHIQELSLEEPLHALASLPAEQQYERMEGFMDYYRKQSEKKENRRVNEFILASGKHKSFSLSVKQKVWQRIFL